MNTNPRFSSHPYIPSEAICVFSGIRSEVFQWEQEMFDGSKKYFERIRYADGAFAIPVTSEWKIILIKQEQPARKKSFLSFPGGWFDSPLEDPLFCAKRELLEETGYMTDDNQWILWKTYFGTPNIALHAYFYIARWAHKVADITPDPGEKIEVVEVTFDELLRLVASHELEHHRDILSHFYDALLDVEKYKELKEFIFSK